MRQEKLKQILEERGITPYRLARDCNIATSDVYSLLKGQRPAYPRWRKSISEYLELPESDIFED